VTILFLSYILMSDNTLDITPEAKGHQKQNGVLLLLEGCIVLYIRGLTQSDVVTS
jgi:hypothetical protein